MSRLWIVLLGVLALGVTSCDRSSDTGKTAKTAVKDAAEATGDALGDAADATGKALGDAAKATGEFLGDAMDATGKGLSDAAEATGDFLTGSKDWTVDTAQDAYNGLNKKWQELQAKAEPTTDEAKANLQKAKEQMARALAAAETKLIEAKDASEDVWRDNIKPAFNAALREAQDLYNATAETLSGN